MTWAYATLIVFSALIGAGIVGTAVATWVYMHITPDTSMRERLSKQDLVDLSTFIANFDVSAFAPGKLGPMKTEEIRSIEPVVQAMADKLQTLAAQCQREAAWMRRELKRRKG